ncbi:MAG: ABC transporter ATP-binding protein, partial [Acidimicrobiales bacterium]
MTATHGNGANGEGANGTGANGTGTNGTAGNGADDHEVLTTTGRAARRGSFGPGGGAGMPVERSRDAGAALRRLRGVLGPEQRVIALCLGLSVVAREPRGHGPSPARAGHRHHRLGVREGGIDFGRLHRQLLFVGSIYLGSWALSYGQAYLLAGAIQRSMFRLREAVELKLHALPISYLDQHERGDLLSRVTNDIDNLAQSLQQTTSQIVTSALTIVGVAVMMFTVSPLMAVVALVTVPTSVWLMKVIAGRARPRFMAQWRHTGSLNAQAEEVFTGHAVVKSFGRQRNVEQRFGSENDELFEASRSAQFTASLIQPTMVLMGNLQFALIAVVGGLRIAAGAITVGDMQALIQYARQFSQPLTQLASMTATFQSGLASLERVLELLDADEQRPDPAASDAPPPVRGRVV